MSSGDGTYAPPPAEGSQNQTPSIPPVQIVIIAVVIFGTIAIVAGISLCCRKRRQRHANRRSGASTSNQHLQTASNSSIQYEDWLRIAMGLDQQSNRERIRPPPRSHSRAGQMMRSISRRALRRTDSVRTVEDPPPRYEQALKDKPITAGSVADEMSLMGSSEPVGLAINMPCEVVSPTSSRSSSEMSGGEAVGLGVAM